MKPTRETRHKDIGGDVFYESEYVASNSIEVTRNAKGDYQWSIKIYYRPDAEREDVLNEIGIIDAQLRRAYGSKGEA